MSLHRKKAAGIEILNGWKEIANYLGKGVRTVQRYERQLGLPIRRPAGKPSGSVIATKAELDGWIAASPFRESFQLHPVKRDEATLNEFRQQIAELHRLRSDQASLRQELHESMARLTFELRSLLPDKTISPETIEDEPRFTDGILEVTKNRALEDLLTFPRNKKKAN